MAVAESRPVSKRCTVFLLGCLIAAAFPVAAAAVNVKSVQAPSGMEVWLSEEHALPVIAVAISLPAGSAYDAPGKEGLATMTASLLDEGAANMDGTAFKRALEARAIRFSASASRDYLTVSLQTLSEHRDEAFRLLGLALARPRFDKDAVERMRQAILASLKEDEEDPGTIAAKAWFQIYFGKHPYARPEDGTVAGLRAIAVPDIRAFASTHLVRGKARVAVAGDVTEAQLKKLIEATFGPLSPKAPPSVPRPRNVGRPGSHIIAMDIPQPAAVMGVPGPLRNDPNFIPTFVANYILGGGGFSSRLMDEVRDKRGLTYGISTSVLDYRAAGVLIGRVASDKTRIAQAVDVTKEVMARFVKQGATAKELADAKTYLTGSFPLNFDSNAKIASTLNGFQRAGLGADYVVRRDALIAAVTLAQVNAVARKYFDPAKLTVVMAGTPQKPPPGAAQPSRLPPPPKPPHADKPPTP